MSSSFKDTIRERAGIGVDTITDPAQLPAYIPV